MGTRTHGSAGPASESTGTVIDRQWTVGQTRTRKTDSHERMMRECVVSALRLHTADVNRLGVKWFENRRFSSSRKSSISVRPQGTRPVPPVESVPASRRETVHDSRRGAVPDSRGETASSHNRCRTGRRATSRAVPSIRRNDRMERRGDGRPSWSFVRPVAFVYNTGVYKGGGHI